MVMRFNPVRTGLVALAALALVVAALNWRSPAQPVVAEEPSLTWIGGAMHEPVRYTLIPAPKDPGSGGALAVVDDLILLITRTGALHYSFGEDAFERLPIAAPFDLAALQAPFERQKDRNTVGAKDIVARRTAEGVEVFASHSLIETGNDGAPCYRLAVSRLSVPWPLSPEAAQTAAWRTVFRSQPCLPVAAGVFPLQTAGTMAFVDRETMLLTIGDHGFDNVGRTYEGADPQNPNGHYGKVLTVDLTTGAASVRSMGHRNNAGLTIASDGAIWSTEHGPKGGDELNLLRQGANYGWPLDTYGANYGKYRWPGAPDPGRHDRFEKPIYAWLPSVGVNKLIEYQGGEFPTWRGDLMIATLKANMLMRVRVNDGRVIFVERLHLTQRLRDIALDQAGRIYLKLDDTPAVLMLSRNREDDGMNPALSICAACHQIAPGMAGDQTGPSLVGVVSRPVGRAPGFRYSQALRDLGGAWTVGRLDRYLQDVQAFAPGTTMPQPDLDRDGIAAVLEALQK